MIGNQIAGFFSVGAPPIPPGSYESIATVTVGSGGTSTITFSSIPSTYKHLQIRALYRSAGDQLNSLINFNSDTASNYTYHYILGDGASASSAGTSGSPTATYLQGTNNTHTSLIYAASVIDILDYSSTNKYKTVRNIQGFDTNGVGERMAFWSSAWLNTAAISNIVISNSGTFAQYSSFALYGITGA